MKQADINRLHKLLEETEAFLNKRGATLLNRAITITSNDYDLAGAGVVIELTKPEKRHFRT
jgi:hypothetical protein